jgi:hypothetical protein
MAIAVTAVANPDAAFVGLTANTFTGDPQAVFEVLVPVGNATFVNNPYFTDMTSWTVAGATSSAITAARLVVNAPSNATPSATTVTQTIGPTITGSRRYLVQFWAKASVATTIQVLWGKVTTPVAVTTVWAFYSFYVTTGVTTDQVLQFQLGGKSAAYVFTLDSVNVTPPPTGATNATTIEAGLRFTVVTAGAITHIRFYKPLGDPQTSRKVTLWNVGTGAVIGSGTSVNEPAVEGFVTVALDVPAAVTTGTTYCASYASTAPGLWTTAATPWNPPYNTAYLNITPTTSATSAIGVMPATVDATKNNMVDVILRLTTNVTAVTVGRQDPSGFSALIRYGESIPVVAGYLSVSDHECPFDVPVSYVVAQAIPVGSETGTSNVVTLASNGQTWLKDPTSPGRNLIIPVMTSMTGATRAAQAGVFTILDRANPVVVSTVRASMAATLTCYTLTDSQEQAMIDALGSGSVLLLSGPAAEIGAMYIAIGDVGAEMVGLVTEPARLWTLPFQVVDRPIGVTSPNNVDRTWRAVKTKYATCADLTATGKTWQVLIDSGP